MKTQLIILSLQLLACSAQFVDEFQQIDTCIGEDQYTCLSGDCILHEQYCDGIPQCEDGSDENFCLDHRTNIELCNEMHQFTCHDGVGCIPPRWVCNGVPECVDESDELNCSDVPAAANASCGGFSCGDGKCISILWVCDGKSDCADNSDEIATRGMCWHALDWRALYDGKNCKNEIYENSLYPCLDHSYCLPPSSYCDGLQDCRDGSDEGAFCKNWHTMCANDSCPGNQTTDRTVCLPTRDGPACVCDKTSEARRYNPATRACEPVDECAREQPFCSHTCRSQHGHASCECDDGYENDRKRYLCYAPDPEAMLFFTTDNDIQYLKVKSKELVTVATGIKKALGVSYDGKYLYWVEAALGHQSIVRAHLDDVKGTKETLIGLGLEDPGDIAVDWLGGNIYFSDTERGVISVCLSNGHACATIKTNSKHPRFVALDARNGQMYWADWHDRPVLMSAGMDGRSPRALPHHPSQFPTGLTVDASNRRLYFVDGTIKVAMLDHDKVYSLFEEPYHHPYSIAVFENTVFWNDLTSNTLQTTDKLHGSKHKRNILIRMKKPVFGLHMYHPVMMNTRRNPCRGHNCSHLCVVTSNVTYTCLCPDGMVMKNGECQASEERPPYLVVGGGNMVTRIQYSVLGNMETHATHLDGIGRVQAMTYDSKRDNLYIYDGQRRTLNYLNMSDFSVGLTNILLYTGLDNVLDMDYDYISDSLYLLDAGRRALEVLSLRTQRRVVVYRFDAAEVPLAFCLVPDYGKVLVAVAETDQNNDIHIDSLGMDGEGRTHVVTNNLRGPHIRLRYVQEMDQVFISDEGNGLISYMHPEGSGWEDYREVSAAVSTLAVGGQYVFWGERRAPRLYWADIHESSPRIRKVDFTLFPNTTKILLQSTSPPPNRNGPLWNHPCRKLNPCSQICVITSNPSSLHSHQIERHSHGDFPQLGYKCLCTPGLTLIAGKCTKVAICKENQFYCHKSNTCFYKHQMCDGKRDCTFGEDEEDCGNISVGVIVKELNDIDFPNPLDRKHRIGIGCDANEFTCANSSLCISRSLLCDRQADCPDGSDEEPTRCGTMTCFDTEFMCASGSCILKTWTCDGDRDCNDASDEINCDKAICKQGFYQCRNRECIEVRRRCDGVQDCFDFSDEEDCDEPVIVEMIQDLAPSCAAWEYMCELNNSICLPLSARCNMKVECPGGTDENGCEFRCTPHGMFACRQQLRCLTMHRVCNGKKDCEDGSDETPDACALVDRSSRLYPISAECHGYRCGARCLEWQQVCDHTKDCDDGSDEGGDCLSACVNNKCSHICDPTPHGAVCHCPNGFRLGADGRTCEDEDECDADTEPCSQLCHNVQGSFLCTCNYGYALKSDKRSCKATSGTMSVVYASGSTARSVAADGTVRVQHRDPADARITDLDYNVREKKLYLTSVEAGKLVEVNSANNTITVTNVGIPSRVAVDWVTGNVYFVDSTPNASCVRVCDIRRKKCAKLQSLPSDGQVTAFILEPVSRRMFYCVTLAGEAAVRVASLSGAGARRVATVRGCSGLAADPGRGALYLAQPAPAQILKVDFNGDDHKKVLVDHPQLQAPQGLAIFEDHIYYHVADSFRLGRCLLFGHKYCEIYIYRVFNADAFVISHESVQRQDLRNECRGFSCEHVCVLDEFGPRCVCADGRAGGPCANGDRAELPLFNGWAGAELARAHRASFAVITSVLGLFTLYLALFLFYHFVHKPRQLQNSTYTEVRFQNAHADDPMSAYKPTIQMTTDVTTTSSLNEFINPVQFIRNIWNQSFRGSPRPIGTATLSIDVPISPQDLSDTESDLDDKEMLITRRR